MPAIIEPTASKVASLLPGETIVSPSKKDRPFFGNESWTNFIYSELCVISKISFLTLEDFFHIRFLLFVFLKFSKITKTLSIFSGVHLQYCDFDSIRSY